MGFGGKSGGELSWPWQFTPFQKLSFSVDQVVRSLVDANIIGKGCYGVVVLEVLTGKQPIDPTIPDGLHVVDWVRRCRDRAGVLDPALRRRSSSEVEEMLQVMGVALLCVSAAPDDRPTMKDVAAMLKEIRLEREDVANVDVLLKGGSSPPHHVHANAAAIADKATSSTSSTPPCPQGPSNSCSSSSFSAIYSLSNKAKSPFG